MKFKVLLDYDTLSGLREVDIDLVDNYKFNDYFINKNYSCSQIIKIVIILFCRNPEYEFKQRIRLYKNDKVLYIDLMFDLNIMKELDHNSRCELTASKFINEIPIIIKRYIKRKQITNFDIERFTDDLTNFFENICWYNK